SQQTGAVDSIILVPLFGRGGAERVAINYARMLRKTRNDKSSIIISTDHDILDSTVKIPAGTHFFQIKEFLSGYGEAIRQEFLFRIIQLVRPRICHIINSDLGWRVTQIYGERLQKLTRLFGSMFCMQHNYDTGELLGYAAYYFSDAVKHCQAILSDNKT